MKANIWILLGYAMIKTNGRLSSAGCGADLEMAFIEGRVKAYK